MKFVRLWVLLSVVSALSQAGQGGFIAGIVRDRSGALISQADVRVQNEQTGARQRVLTDASGSYSTSELAPGSYKLTIRRDSFRTASRGDIVVSPGKTMHADFTIELLPIEQEVTVTAAESRDNPMVSGVTVSRDSPTGHLPENGRDVHALFSLMPGATITPASITSGGQFTVGGQRPNTNSFRVDGVNGNVGIGVVALPGAYLGGSLPVMTTIGGTETLASQEETERVELRSADFSAQSGDRPGAQIDIQTRTGSNEFHGSLLGYLRPLALDSQDWFARGAASHLPPASVNGWGGSVGGPIWRNHSYFFASLEREDVHDSALQLLPVASAAARATASPTMQAVFDAFPQPTGRPLTADESVGYSPLEKAASVTSSSFRFDQIFGQHTQMFIRYTYVPSNATTTELGAAYSNFHWTSVTLGVNVAAGHYTQQFRFNTAYSNANAIHGPADASSPLNSLEQIWRTEVPDFYGDQIAQLSVGGQGQTVTGQANGNSERQLQGAYLLERQGGRHDIRAGGDYTVLSTIELVGSDSLAIASPGIDSLLAGVPLGMTIADFTGPNFRTEHWSTFVQDTIHTTNRLDLLLGLRWEFAPSPYRSSQDSPTYYPYVGYWQGIGATPVALSNYTETSTIWPERLNQLAPRLGLAYRLPWHDVVLRAGAGIFYDTEMGSIISNENPLAAWQYVPTSLKPPTNTTAPQVYIPPVLSLPRVLEWRTSLEKSLGEASTASLSYIGSAGRRLVQNQATIDPQTSMLDTLAFTSQGRSDYEALLVQYRASLTSHLYALVSYTFSHSIDNGSSDTTPVLVQPGISSINNRGSSNFDVRHVLNTSLAYRAGNRWNSWCRNWSISSNLFARTGFPFDVTTVDRSVGFGFDNTGRAALVPNEPIWMSNSAAPGGRELNPAAFQVPSGPQSLPIGRNVLTGNGLFQVDASLRRQFRLFRGFGMETSVSAFNLLNHAAFSNPVSYLGSALFGQSTSTANLMLGSGSPTTGLTPLYQAGGPRTIELGVRFTF